MTSKDMAKQLLWVLNERIRSSLHGGLEVRQHHEPETEG